MEGEIVYCIALAAGTMLGGGGMLFAIGEHPREAPGRMRRDLIAYYETGIGGMLCVCGLVAMAAW